MRSAQAYVAIQQSLSAERLDKYLVATAYDVRKAIELYERNMRLAEAFYTPLQCMEVCLRNRLQLCLESKYGADWHQNQRPPFAADALEAIAEAIRDLQFAKKKVTAGAVVAELHFGFWVGLLAPRYDATLWRQTFYLAFTENGARMRRDRVHHRFNALRRFRNRVAHHEPIFLNDLPARHTEIIEATSWLCTHTAAWALSQSRFQQVYTAP